jgi:lipopolysaccharide biosynthesis regulator YciM
MARDWDLFTMSTTALVPFVLLVLNRYIRSTGIGTDAVARFAVPSLMVLLVTSVAWVSVNASTDRTIDRFRSILTYDRTHASYAWENLAMLQHNSKQLDAAIETMRIAVDHSHNPRQQVRLAVYMDEAGKTEEAKQILEKILERRPAFGKARFLLLLLLEREANWAKILGVARDGVKHTPRPSTSSSMERR